MSIIFDKQHGAIYRGEVDVSELGALLRKARSDIGLSQGDLARMTGLSRQTINYAEQGRVGLGADSLLDLMGLLGIRFEQNAEDERALALLAKTASVSYRETLPATTLLKVLRDGVLPDRWLPHIATLLDEAPGELLLRGVREAARRSGRPAQEIWRNAQELAKQTASTHPRWRYVS